MAFKDNDPKKLWEGISHADYRFVFISMFVGWIAFISRALRWNLLLEPMGYKINKWNALHAVSVGYLANLAVPRMGEITRCSAIAGIEKVPVQKLIGTVILERVVDLMMMALCFGLALVVQYDLIFEFFDLANANGASESSESSSSGIVLLLVGAVFVLTSIFTIVFRKRLLKIALVQKIIEFVKGMLEGIRSIFKLKKQGLFWFHTLSIWIMYFLMGYVNFFCIPETSHLTLRDGIFIMIVASMGMVAPAPGGMGAYHFAVITGLTVLAIDVSAAQSYAIITHSAQTIMMIVTGSIGLIMLSLSRKRAKDTHGVASQTA